jgi:uncharacterized membrane protein
MRLPATDAWTALAGGIALAYPFVVWFGLSSLPPSAFVLLALVCVAARMIGIRRLSRSSVELVAFALAGAGLVALLMIAPSLAARTYPVAISLALAAVFTISLHFPPTIVERIARLSEPDLPPAGIAYTRRVTQVWVAFLLINAVISLWTAVYGSLAQWTLWNGLLSYIAMGCLFAIEFLIRRMVRR